jgi:hypothetical protein
MVRFTAMVVAAAAVLVPAREATANSKCLPEEILLHKQSHLFEDHAVRLAFVEAMNARQFEALKNASQRRLIAINGLPAENFQDLGSARLAGRAEASARLSNLDAAESRRLIANRLSADDNSAYVDCLRSQKDGLLAWVQVEEGNLVRLSVLFRPDNDDHEFRRPTMLGFEIISRPGKKFVPHETQTLLFKRTSSDNSLIELHIGTESAVVTFPPRQKLVVFSDNTYVSPDVAFAWAGNLKSESSSRTGNACMTPPTGRTFVLGSERLVPIAGHSVDTQGEFVSAEPDKICWKVTVEPRPGPRPAIGRVRASAELQQIVSQSTIVAPAKTNDTGGEPKAPVLDQAARPPGLATTGTSSIAPPASSEQAQ